jgi:hypothetical protein
MLTEIQQKDKNPMFSLFFLKNKTTRLIGGESRVAGSWRNGEMLVNPMFQLGRKNTW